MSILDEINEALATNEALMAVLRTGELPFNLLSPADLGEMSIDQLKSVSESNSALDLVRKTANEVVTLYETKKKELQKEGNFSPAEIEEKAAQAIEFQRRLSLLTAEDNLRMEKTRSK